MMAMLAENDQGNAHTVGYMWGTTGMGDDARKVAAAMHDGPSEILAIVLMYLGWEPDSRDPADLAAAEATLMAIRPFVRYIDSVPLLAIPPLVQFADVGRRYFFFAAFFFAVVFLAAFFFAVFNFCLTSPNFACALPRVF
jgi:spermidine/putrescine-binding protein